MATGTSTVIALRRVVVLVFVLGAFLAWLGPTTRAAVADCVTDDESVLIDHADVIFTATLLADQSAKFGREREYVFRVDKVYKGAAFEEQIVATMAKSSVSLELTVQQSYLIQATYPAEGDIGPVARLEGNRCQGTRPLTAENPVPAALGAGQPPAIGSSRSLTSRLEGNIWIAVGIGCIAFAIIYTVRNRRRHPERP